MPASCMSLFYHVQSFLGAVANISKLLWAQSEGSVRKRRKPLRDSLAIKDDSPLMNRKMRDKYEHFDECLDDWWKETPQKFIIDMTSGSVRSLFNPSPVGKMMFRHLDPYTKKLTFWNYEVNLAEVVQALIDLKAQCLKSKESRFPTDWIKQLE